MAEKSVPTRNAIPIVAGLALGVVGVVCCVLGAATASHSQLFLAAASRDDSVLLDVHSMPSEERRLSSKETSGAIQKNHSRPVSKEQTGSANGSEPNPPEWPSTVMVFEPGQANIREMYEKRTEILRDRKPGHFSEQRLAALFKPGKYWVDLNVGYYTQVLGLGENADDVVFAGNRGVYAPAMDPGAAGSLDTFWRGAENFKSEAWWGLMWAVSQAAPLRRVHVARDLLLSDNGGFASGGFSANVKIEGGTKYDRQQQWFTRNSEMKWADAHFWNYVFMGSGGLPWNQIKNPAWPSSGVRIVNIPSTPVIAEKPFITINAEGKYSLQIPKVGFNTWGTSLSVNPETVRTVPFEEVFVATSEMETRAIQAKLDDKLHVVLSPGIYHLTESLVVKHHGQTLLGIGMAQLMGPTDGKPCVKITDGARGVRVAGLMLSATTLQEGSYEGSTLLEWGELGDAGDAEDPGFLFDIFARVGGLNRKASVHTMVRINSGNVVGDHLWLWRADHNKLHSGEYPGWNFDGWSEYHLTAQDEAVCAHGLVVLGDHVTMYGLQVEHTLETLTVWKGNYGRTYFYQSEIPYDVSQESYADKGYVAYEVAADVTHHEAYGVAVYCYFRDHEVWMPTAIRAPTGPNIKFVNPFTKYLNGHGGFKHVINDVGPAEYRKWAPPKNGRQTKPTPAP